MKKLFLLIWLSIMCSSAFAQRTIVITGNGSIPADTTVVKCSYMRANDALSPLWTGNIVHIGSNYDKQYAYLYFPTIADSIGSNEKVDSCFIGLRTHATNPHSGDNQSGSIIPEVCRSLRSVTYTEFCYNYYTGTTPWQQYGAWGAADVSSRYPVTNHLKVNLSGTWVSSLDTSDVNPSDTVFFKVPPEVIDSIDNADFVDNGFIIHYDTAAMTGEWYLGFLEEAFIYVYVSPSTAVNPPDGAQVDSVHNDFSSESDSIGLQVTTSADAGYDKVIVAWSTTGYPDSSNSGDTLEWPYTPSTTFLDTVIVNGTESYTLYLSSWQYDVVDGWSSRKTASRYFSSTTPDITPPDVHSFIDAFRVEFVNPDTVRIGVGSVDSIDYTYTVIRYDTISIPLTTADGLDNVFNGSVLENDTSDYFIDVVGQQWVYFAIFAADEVLNWNSGTGDSIYFPAASGGSGSWTQLEKDSIFSLINEILDTNKTQDDWIAHQSTSDSLQDSIETIKSNTALSNFSTTAELIDANWNEDTTGHYTPGKFGYEATQSGSGTSPWNSTTVDSALAALTDLSMANKIWVKASSRGLTQTVDVNTVGTGAITSGSYAAGAINSTVAPNLDVAVSTRGTSNLTHDSTIGADFNHIEGVINYSEIGDGFLQASKVAVGALNGKGDWNIGKDNYSVSSVLPGAINSNSYSAGAINSTVAPNLDVAVSSRASDADIQLTISMLDTLIIFKSLRLGSSSDMAYTVDWDTLRIYDQAGQLWGRWLQRHVGQGIGAMPDSAFLLGP